MNTPIVLIIILLLTSPVWAQEELADKYDENTELTLTGQIIEISERGRGPIILKVRSDRDNRLYNVVTAPAWFLARHNINFKVGERIEVVGSKFLSKSGEIFVVSRQCRFSNFTPCALRDNQMRPRWRGGIMR